MFWSAQQYQSHSPVCYLYTSCYSLILLLVCSVGHFLKDECPLYQGWHARASCFSTCLRISNLFLKLPESDQTVLRCIKVASKSSLFLPLLVPMHLPKSKFLVYNAPHFHLFFSCCFPAHMLLPNSVEDMLVVTMVWRLIPLFMLHDCHSGGGN